jgi:pimeloyl-ACP methyl ester carboxylesterase
MTRVRSAIAALLALPLLVSCTGSSGGAPAAVPRSPAANATTTPGSATADVPADLSRFYGQALRWRDCGSGFDCTRLLVPVDYASPAGATLRLAVVRRPADGKRLGSLVLNPGGPGASGVDYARAANTVISKALRERYDVVGFDPRGTGRSHPVQCLSGPQLDAFLAQDASPDDASEEQALVQSSRRLGQACQARTGALLAHVGTRDVARDLDVLRAALGDRRLTYLGFSYGTYLGELYASLFPSKVGRLVLDGVVDPADDTAALTRAQAGGFQVALTSFVDDCLSRRGCPLSGTRAEALDRVGSLLAAADRKPLRGSRPVTQALATIGIAEAMYTPEYWGFLRLALRDALNGDGDALLTLADAYAHRDDDGTYSDNLMVALYAVSCLDQPETADLAAFRARAVEYGRIAPFFGTFTAWGTLPCSYWPYPAEGKPAPVRAAGAPPILVVGTTRDPATPYADAVHVARELDHARLLTYVADGHAAYGRGSDCIDGHVDTYLITGKLPPLGTRCH